MDYGLWLGFGPVEEIWKKSMRCCQKGVGSNAISCGGCLFLIHKKCNGIKGPLGPDPGFSCARCLGTARPMNGRTVKEVTVDKEKLETVSRDLLSRGHALCSRWL